MLGCSPIESCIYISDDEGSESGLSASIESEEEEPNHHLLTAPNGDVAFLKEKPVRLARELL